MSRLRRRAPEFPKSPKVNDGSAHRHAGRRRGRGAVLGIVSERDIVNGFVERGRDLSEATAADLMTADVLTCTPADTIAQLMSTMTERRIRHLPVVDESGLCGIVSIGDVVKNRLDEIEAEAEALREYVTTA